MNTAKAETIPLLVLSQSILHLQSVLGSHCKVGKREKWRRNLLGPVFILANRPSVFSFAESWCFEWPHPTFWKFAIDADCSKQAFSRLNSELFMIRVITRYWSCTGNKFCLFSASLLHSEFWRSFLVVKPWVSNQSLTRHVDFECGQINNRVVNMGWANGKSKQNIDT